MRQFIWLYVRAWLWAHLPEKPRLAPALGGWLGLALVSGLSQYFHREIWPHTPAAAGWSAAGLGLGLTAAALLLGRDLWHWWRAWQPGLWRWVLLLVLGPLLGLGLLALVLTYVALLA